jgi:transposase
LHTHRTSRFRDGQRKITPSTTRSRGTSGPVVYVTDTPSPAQDNGRKRFIVTDTLGLLIVVVVCAASVQDRDGARQALLGMYFACPVRFVFADGGFAGQLLDWATRILRTTVEIVRKPKDQKGFAVIPRRWAVERTLAWLTAHRRLARDYERQPETSEAMIRWAAISGMVRRITRGQPATRQARRTYDWTT